MTDGGGAAARGQMIVSCGEALVDLIPTGADGDGLLRPVLGGGPFNTAIALARLGVPTGFVGRVSEGGYGRRLEGRLREEGVDLRYLGRGPEPTTLALVTRKPDGDNHYDLYLGGTAALALTHADMPDDLTGVGALHIGTLGLAVEPAASAFGALLEREADRRLVSLDPNIRPAAIPDMRSYRQRMEGWVRRAALVKVSDADMRHLFPGTDPRDAARAWAGLGAAMTVLTLGPDGAVAWTAAGEVAVPGVPVRVADTVGAGDTLAAGLLAWLWEHGALTRDAVTALTRDEVAECLRFACAAAAVTCSRPGADPPRRADLPGAHE